MKSVIVALALSVSFAVAAAAEPPNTQPAAAAPTTAPAAGPVIELGREFLSAAQGGDVDRVTALSLPDRSTPQAWRNLGKRFN